MFVRAGQRLISVASIQRLDLEKIEALEVVVHHEGGVDIAKGPDAIDLLMELKPSALEGRRLRWHRGVWAFHNLVGHPVMQILAWCGLSRLGLRVHDATVPRPKEPSC